ncbi:monovalent cation/H(+) antiporter subunit G [Streptomyces albus subsp. chlorinus]|uniref:monovalent cation/H(+) antiporter subunit G n=1 Tax=Streptomyces albus TaxID=1888 RepID=UPI00156F6C43|nr:monovalent cation/H(+) antiporter subunit G [Streptomyces albus]NSC21124.1 monovalent cation/H(+) antiporter subunit G [Streptomyces albus subsp. chlorinus]
MSWIRVADVAGAGCMLAGAVLCLLAGIGLLRLPDVLTRMHAATKPQSFGLLLVLIGSGLRLRSAVDLGILLLVGLFQLVTSPVAAHMVGRAAYRTGRVDRDDLVLDELGEALRGKDSDSSPGGGENRRSAG